MNRAQIKAVKALCADVSAACDEALADLPKDVQRASDRFWAGTKASGALRRRSLDLTRALAEMRRPS